MTSAEQKGKAKRQQIEDYLAFLDERMPKLMAEGYKGRSARHEADRQWALEQRDRKSKQDDQQEDAPDRNDHG